jgi:23S rRNA (uracil1939-C5)-methyltransferase
MRKGRSVGMRSTIPFLAWAAALAVQVLAWAAALAVQVLAWAAALAVLVLAWAAGSAVLVLAGGLPSPSGLRSVTMSPERVDTPPGPASALGVAGGAGPELELTTTAPANGGAAIARDPDGRVVLVEGALPGERVTATVIERRRDFLRARVLRVVDASPERVAPPCPHVAEGCGGCDLQHVAASAQPDLKRAVVVDALRRIGRIDDPAVVAGPPLPATGFRTTVRAAVVDGRAGFRAARSHEVVPVDSCLVAHPAIEALLVRGRFDGCDEVTVRVGAATGDRLVVGTPTATGIDLPEGLAAATRLVGDDELDAGKRAWIFDEVAGRRFRISARSFFQTRPDGAAALVGAVGRAGGDELVGATRVVDAYAGVGLFGATVVPAGAALVAIEASPSSAADARINLEAARPDASNHVARSTVERWRPRRADVVIADPARAGLDRASAAVLARTGAGALVLVSCDAAALARDARLLLGHGFRHRGSEVIDLFPHTHHVEVVSSFVR